jgi:NADPH:quinone reductase-like Zn-dependent oxidoreductase
VASIVDKAQLSAGQKILIHAAAGGVGSFAVQFTKWKGAHVIGTALGKNQAFLRELGVDEPIDFDKELVLRRLRLSGMLDSP